MRAWLQVWRCMDAGVAASVVCWCRKKFYIERAVLRCPSLERSSAVLKCERSSAVQSLSGFPLCGVWAPGICYQVGIKLLSVFFVIKLLSSFYQVFGRRPK